MAKQQRTFTFGLSEEELLVILGHLKVNQMAGLDLEPYRALSAEQAAPLLAAAERALFARGFLRRGAEGRLTVNPLVFALVGACIEAERSAFLSRAAPQRVEDTCYFHQSGKMNVLHTLPAAGIHQFLAVEEARQQAQSFLSLLELDSLPEGGKAVGQRLATAALTEARQAARDGGERAAGRRLKAAGMSASAAQDLARSLAQPRFFHTAAFIARAGDLADGFSLLAGAGGAWLLTPSTDEKDDSVLVETAAAAAVARRVAAGFGLAEN